MTKQEQFLWVVQTAVLANGINLSSRPESLNKYTADFSATGILGLADEALRASSQIPDDKSAFIAADEFCNYMLRSLREANEAASGKAVALPSWFARG